MEKKNKLPVGFHCFEEVFSEEQFIKVFGEKIKLVGFDFIANSIVAICKKKEVKSQSYS